MDTKAQEISAEASKRRARIAQWTATSTIEAMDGAIGRVRYAAIADVSREDVAPVAAELRQLLALLEECLPHLPAAKPSEPAAPAESEAAQ